MTQLNYQDREKYHAKRSTIRLQIIKTSLFTSGAGKNTIYILITLPGKAFRLPDKTEQ